MSVTYAVAADVVMLAHPASMFLQYHSLPLEATEYIDVLDFIFICVIVLWKL